MAKIQIKSEKLTPFFLVIIYFLFSYYLLSPLEKVENRIFLSLQLKFRKFCPTRPERAEALSPGQRPGLFWTQTCRPVRAKALKLQAIYKAFALTGRLADCHYTQGAALG